MEKDVSYIVYEGTMARFERIIKRLIAVIIILLGIIAYGVYEWTQYDTYDVDLDSKDGGNANYIGASGVINNGTGASKNEEKKDRE